MLCAEYSDSDEDVIPSSVTAPPVATPASFTTALATINAAPAIEEKVRVAICCCLYSCTRLAHHHHPRRPARPGK